MIKFRDHYNFSGFNVAPPIFWQAHYIDLLVTHIQILHFINKIFVISRLITKFLVPQNLELYGILLLIYCPHKLPHRIPHSSTIQLQRYRFHTEYHYRTLWTNLAVSLSKQVHFAVLVLSILHPPALHSAISRMRNRTFPCYGLTFSFLRTRLIISAGQNLLACRIL